jgi:SAM-dependent MidA family methyltransferase
MTSLSSPPPPELAQAISQAGGWLAFDAFMALALYAPGWGYYSGERRKFGLMPQSGSDFVTAPELSAHFGRALATQVAQALAATGTTEVWEFGAGSGALAEQVLTALEGSGVPLTRYVIVDLSGSLQARQQDRLAAFAGRVQWLHSLPEDIQGVVIGNEVLDAMPVKLLQRTGGVWSERGVALQGGQLVVELETAGRVQRAEFNREWVRVEPKNGDGSLIEVSGQGRSVRVGRHIRPELRPALAREIRFALRGC